MTENEARKLITKFCEDRMNFARGKDMSDKELDGFCKFSDALNLSISSLEEIQQYRAIGTVEECREAREKQIPKKPIHDGLYACPNCHTIMLQGMWAGIGLERSSLSDINTRIEEEGQENNDTFRYIQNYGRLSL